MDTKLLGQTVTALCCPPRATAVAMGVSASWGPTAAVGRLRPKTPTTRGASPSFPAGCTWAAAAVATVYPSGLSKINDCA